MPWFYWGSGPSDQLRFAQIATKIATKLGPGRGAPIGSMTTRAQPAENSVAPVRAEGLDPSIAEALLGLSARRELSDAPLLADQRQCARKPTTPYLPNKRLRQLGLAHLDFHDCGDSRFRNGARLATVPPCRSPWTTRPSAEHLESSLGARRRWESRWT